MIKRRAIGIVLTVVAMAFAMIPLMGNDKAFADDNVVATIGDTPYESLAAAVEAARTEKTTIVLEADTVEGVVIPAGADITIDLNGHTIKNAPDESQAEGKPHTIRNYGKLELLSSDGEGVIDNITHAKAGLMNEADGTVIISGKLKFIRSNLPLPASATRGSWYNICNHGDMTINEGVTVVNNDHRHIAISTGYLPEEIDALLPGVKDANLTVNGGYFEGRSAAFKVDFAGNMVINGGTVVAKPRGDGKDNASIVSWNTLQITGGTFEGDYALNLNRYSWEGETNNPPAKGIVDITGGTFTCDKGKYVFTRNSSSTGDVKLTIEGGTFNGSFNSIHLMNLSGEPYIKCHIEGGKFDRDVNAIYNDNATLPVGKVLLQDEDGYYTLHEITQAALGFSADGYGTIDDWTFRGDVNDDKKISGTDYDLLAAILKGASLPQGMTEKEAQRIERNMDVNADGKVDSTDLALLGRVFKGEVTLPYNDSEAKKEALAFEVKDIPAQNYEITSVTVNGEILNVPAKGETATTKAENNVTYTVAIDADGKGSVSGKYLAENEVVFKHGYVATIEPTLEISTDNKGSIDDWTFRGDINDDKKLTGADVDLLAAILKGAPLPQGTTEKEALRIKRNMDVNADGKVDSTDWAILSRVLSGEITLPYSSSGASEEAVAFEVKDIPNEGYEIATITVNEKGLILPVDKGTTTTKVGDVTYTVIIDEDGKGSVSGKYLEDNEIKFTHEKKDNGKPTLTFSSDDNGQIDDWTFRGDANLDQKLSVRDLTLINSVLTNPPENPDGDKELARKLRNADVDGNGVIETGDLAVLNRILLGAISFPYPGTESKDACTFEVKDVPKDGYQIALVTVNGELLEVPAKGKSATTKVGDVTYTVTIDADGKGSVSGKYLKENKVAFAHEPIVTPRGDVDPPSDKPTEEEFDKIVTATNTDGDFAGSTFGHLRARGVAKGKKKVLIRWTDPKLGAAKFILYGNRCNTKGKKYTYVKMKEFNANTFKYIPTDIHGQKLKKGTYYKFVVAAVDKDGKVVAISKTVHVTTNGGKKGNYKSVKRVKPTKKAKYTLNVGKTKKLKVKAVKGKKKVAKHRAVAWESLNPEVATVSKGKVTARGKGTCTIFAYAQNGVYTTFKITVK